MIDTKIKKCIKEDELMNILLDFISNNIKVSLSYEDCIKEINKLVEFVKKNEMSIDIDLAMDMINYSEILNNLVGKIVSFKKDLIISGDLSIFNNTLEIFVRAYCGINNIEITERAFDLDYYSDNTLKMYFKEASAYPLLTKEEEIELFKRLKNGDESARDIIINSNLRLVILFAKGHNCAGLTFLDLIQEGNIGLMKAVDKFDLSKKCRFSTYASWWIKQAIERAIDNKDRLIRLPVHMSENVNKLKSAKEKFVLKYDREPSNEELADILNISLEQVESYIKESNEVLSLDFQVILHSRVTLVNVISDNSTVSPEQSVIAQTENNELYACLNLLPENERQVLYYLFGFVTGEDMTLQAVADKFGVSRERIRQIKVSALRRLKRYISASQKGVCIMKNPDENNSKTKKLMMNKGKK